MRNKGLRILCRCRQCEAVFETKEVLASHVEEAHGDLMVETEMPIQDPIMISETGEELGREVLSLR